MLDLGRRTLIVGDTVLTSLHSQLVFGEAIGMEGVSCSIRVGGSKVTRYGHEVFRAPAGCEDLASPDLDATPTLSDAGDPVMDIVGTPLSWQATTLIINGDGQLMLRPLNLIRDLPITLMGRRAYRLPCFVEELDTVEEI